MKININLYYNTHAHLKRIPIFFAYAFFSSRRGSYQHQISVDEDLDIILRLIDTCISNVLDIFFVYAFVAFDETFMPQVEESRRNRV